MTYIAIAKTELTGTAEDDSSIIFGASILRVAKQMGLDGRVFLKFFVDEEDAAHIVIAMNQSDIIEQHKIKELLELANDLYLLMAVSPEYRLTTKH